MPNSSRDGADRGPEFSRRSVLAGGAAAGALLSTPDSVWSDVAAAIDGSRPASLAWERELSEPLDPLALLVERAGVVVARTWIRESGERTLHALDLATGEQLWSDEAATLPSMWTHDGVLYQHSLSELRAIDPRTGEQAWSVTERFSTPVRLGRRHAAFSGLDHRATVVNLQEGSAWRPDDGALTDPVALSDDTVVLSGGGELVAFDATDGRRRAALGGFTDAVTTQVTGEWPLVFVNSTDPDKTVAVDLDEGRRRWIRPERLDPVYFPDATEEGVVLATDGGTLVRLDPATGSTRWSRDVAETDLLVYEVGNGVAVPVAEGAVWAVDLADGTVRWSRQVDTAIPVVGLAASGDGVYTSGRYPREFGLDGEQRWAHELSQEVPVLPAVGTEAMVVTAGRSVFAFDITTRTTPSTDATATAESTTAPAGTGVETATTQPETVTDGTTAGGTPRDDGGRAGTREPAGTDVITFSYDGPGFGVVAAILGVAGGAAAGLLRQYRPDDGDGDA